VLGLASAGVAPRVMGVGPIPAVQKLCARLGLAHQLPGHRAGNAGARHAERMAERDRAAMRVDVAVALAVERVG
jgi:acetyl-CoA acetyltransferase